MTFVERRRLDAGSAVVNADDAPRKASHDARPPSRASANLVLAIVCVGIVLANLDLFIVNVALPRIGQDFRSATLEDLLQARSAQRWIKSHDRARHASRTRRSRQVL